MTLSGHNGDDQGASGLGSGENVCCLPRRIGVERQLRLRRSLLMTKHLLFPAGRGYHARTAVSIPYFTQEVPVSVPVEYQASGPLALGVFRRGPRE